MPAILDPATFVARLDRLDLDSKIAPFVIGDDEIRPPAVVDHWLQDFPAKTR